MGRHQGPVTRDRGKKPPYQLHGGIPWPELGDGTPYVLNGSGEFLALYAPAGARPRSTERHWVGRVQTVAWCHPDGTYMAGDEQTTKATKTKPSVTRPGAWWAVVSWDRRDEPDAPPSRVPLADLAKA